MVLASAEPHQPVTASTVQEISTASSSHSAQTHVPPSVPPVADPPAEADTRAERQPVKPTERRASDLTSQRLWNAAYDNLENDENTAKLVKSYVEILAGVLETTGAADTSISTTDDNSIELKDPIKRQTYMRKLVEEGRKKIATTSKITEGGGNVVGYIEKAKGMIDAAIGNIPQAALPWAGVCVGLQVRYHPSHFACLVFRVTDTRLDPLESGDGNEIESCGHCSCYFEDEGYGFDRTLLVPYIALIAKDLEWDTSAHLPAETP